MEWRDVRDRLYRWYAHRRRDGLVLLLLAGTALAQQDVFQQSFTPYVSFLNLAWGSGAGAVNNNFWFNTLQAEQGVCVWVTNLNPIFSHSFSLTVSSTPDASIPGFTGFTGRWTSTANSAGISFPFTLTANSTTTFFYSTRSSAYIALQFSGTAAAGGGSPDTANIIAVLTNATNCSAVVLGNTVIGPTQAGSAISVSNNNPLVVGGKQNVSGNETSTALFADVDSTTRGFIVGVTGSSNEATGTWTQGQLNNSNSGSPQYFTTNTTGMQSDVVAGAGAGDTLAVARISRAYGVAVSSPWAWASTQEAGLSSANLKSFVAQKDATNPPGGFLLLSININNATNRGLSPYRITVSCSAACDYTINRVTDAGTGCTAVTVNKAFDTALSGPALTVGAETGTCVASPTISATLYHIFLPAAGTNTIDMTGYYWDHQTTSGNGFDVQEGAAVAAGTVAVTWEFINRGNP